MEDKKISKTYRRLSITYFLACPFLALISGLSSSSGLKLGIFIIMMLINIALVLIYGKPALKILQANRNVKRKN